MSITIRDMTEEDLESLRRKHVVLNPDLEVSHTVKASLDIYISHQISPGGFLIAVLANDLFGALSQADSYNRATIFQIVQYIYNNLPKGSHGSKEIVTQWLHRGE